MAQKEAKAYTVRPAQGWEDVLAIHAILLEMHKEIAVAPLNNEKTLQHISDVVYQHAAFMAEDENQTLVGSIGLFRSVIWYSDSEEMNEVWLYVLPHARAKNALGELTLAASEYAESEGVPLVITQANPNRQKSRGRRSLIAKRFVIIPIGNVMKIEPRSA